MQKDNLLNRELYRKIKSMDRDAMERTLNNIYDMAAKIAVSKSNE